MAAASTTKRTFSPPLQEALAAAVHLDPICPPSLPVHALPSRSSLYPTIPNPASRFGTAKMMFMLLFDLFFLLYMLHWSLLWLFETGSEAEIYELETIDWMDTKTGKTDNNFSYKGNSFLFSFLKLFGSCWSIEPCWFSAGTLITFFLFWDLSQQLAGCDSSFAQGLDLERETRASSPSTNANISSTKSNALSASKEQVLDEVLPEEHQLEERSISSSIHIVSQNLREESHNDIVSVEALPSPSRQHRRLRPGSLDLNASSAYVKNSFAPPNLCIKSNLFPSPGTPNYWHCGAGVSNYSKGWSSERVPLPASHGQKYGINAPFFPFNNGRTMPSKWEDAERWICSPVSGDGSRKPLMLPPYHRRPKSKSGPLGDPSPQVPCFDNGKVVNFAGTSPLLAGVLVTDQQCCGGAGGERYEQEDYDCGEQFFTANLKGYTDQSTSMHGWLDMLMEPSTSLPSSDGAFQGDRLADMMEAATVTSAMIFRRDVGTQMSPEGSTHSSPKESTYISHSQPSTRTVTELQSHSPCLEIRDVPVDDRVMVTRWSKKHISRCSDQRSTDIIDWRRKTVESSASSWKVVYTEKHISKYDREDAKIIAWENLQKAKAEAALWKLEMKLEKKRSSSMDKILKKLKSSHKKVQNMRNSVVDRQAHLVSRTRKPTLNIGKYCICSLSCCFDTHAVRHTRKFFW